MSPCKLLCVKQIDMAERVGFEPTRLASDGRAGAAKRVRTHKHLGRTILCTIQPPIFLAGLVLSSGRASSKGRGKNALPTWLGADPKFAHHPHPSTAHPIDQTREGAIQTPNPSGRPRER